LTEQVTTQVEFEITQIDRLFEAYADLLERSQRSTPELVEMTALASVLHSFYNGVENIFLSVAKGLDKDVPTGFEWHGELLVRMTQARPSRGQVISAELAQKLTDYLGFRHFYRHSYSLFLEWSKLEKLVIPLQEVWTQVKKEVRLFLDSLSSGRGQIIQ